MEEGYRVVLWNEHGPIVIEQNLDQALQLIKLFA
jgi:ribulose-5-phosphate 4-epimerase/fuculose-1-phosphate aldolase